MQATENVPAVDFESTLRRWVILAGYAIGGWLIFEEAFIFISYQAISLHRGFRLAMFDSIFWFASVVILASPAVLVAGCWGFQHGRRWGRPTLILYAFIWIAALLVTRTIDFIDVFTSMRSTTSPGRSISLALDSLDPLVYGSVYPGLLLIYLFQPRLSRPTLPADGQSPATGIN